MFIDVRCLLQQVEVISQDLLAGVLDNPDRDIDTCTSSSHSVKNKKRKVSALELSQLNAEVLLQEKEAAHWNIKKLKLECAVLSLKEKILSIELEEKLKNKM